MAVALTALVASLGVAHAPTAGATIPPTVCNAVVTTANPGVIATGTNSMSFTLGVNGVTCTGPSIGARNIQIFGTFNGPNFFGQWNDTAGCRQNITGTASGVTFNGTMTGSCGVGPFSLHWPAAGGTLHGAMV